MPEMYATPALFHFVAFFFYQTCFDPIILWTKRFWSKLELHLVTFPLRVGPDWVGWGVGKHIIIMLLMLSKFN